MSEIVGVLEYLGFTPDKVVPLLILAWLASIYVTRKFEPLEKAIQSLNHCIVEIQTLLRKSRKFDFKQTIHPFATHISPIVLKNEFKPLVEKPGLDKQINKKLPELIEWLKKQKPTTGIDAQDKIDDFVLSGKVEDYLDLDEYKKYLYKKGRNSVDATAILAVYLYEVLIPKVIK